MSQIKAMEKRATRAHVVIVNWNAGTQLAECLDSLATDEENAATLFAVTIVDNASSDGSLETLTRFDSHLPLTIIRNSQNRGFAAACNQGAAQSKADNLLFLNPDTRVAPGAIAKAVEFLAQPANKNVGILGVQLLDDDGRVTRSSARRPTALAMVGQCAGLDRLAPTVFRTHFMTEWPHDTTREVDQVMGAFFLIRRPLFETLGGFDERFFVYFEDLDLSARARDAGWNTVYFSGAQVFHRGQGTTTGIKDRRLFYFMRSRILYALKHFGRLRATAVIATTLLIEPFVRIAASLFAGRGSTVMDTMRGYALLWADLRNIIRTDVCHTDAQNSAPHAI
jgi:N-acetylglucosaminyl-diphospho-decaprenol L-rhamnosyltransferase